MNHFLGALGALGLLGVLGAKRHFKINQRPRTGAHSSKTAPPCLRASVVKLFYNPRRWPITRKAFKT